MISDILTAVDRLYTDNKKTEDSITRTFKKLSRESTVQILRQLSSAGLSRSADDRAAFESFRYSEEDIGKRTIRKFADDTSDMISDCIVKKISVADEYLL